MRRTLIHVLLGLSLIAGLITALTVNTTAAPEDPGYGRIYFPWVPEDDTFSGIDGVHGSITVQNLEVFPITINVMDAAEDSLTSLRLNPRASQTLTAA